MRIALCALLSAHCFMRIALCALTALGKPARRIKIIMTGMTRTVLLTDSDSDKKGLHQCAKLQDLCEGDCCDCDCYRGKTKSNPIS